MIDAHERDIVGITGAVVGEPVGGNLDYVAMDYRYDAVR